MVALGLVGHFNPEAAVTWPVLVECPFMEDMDAFQTGLPSVKLDENEIEGK